MANPKRNEIAIQLAGQERTMRASFEAILAIEAALQKSIMGIINDVTKLGDISVTAAATIIFHGLRGADDNRLTFNQVGNAVVESGVGGVSQAVIEFLGLSLNGVSVGKSDETEAAQ